MVRSPPLTTPSPVVLSVHGLWMTGLESLVLRHRMVAEGFDVRQFHYHSISDSASSVVERLSAQVRELAQTRTVHVMGHSLGGLLLLRVLRTHADLPVQRTLLLGSPVNGSQSARAFSDLPGASWLIGGVAEDELLRGASRRWSGPGELGVIAGTNSVGLGRFIGNLPEPNDGTVALEETRLDGATDQCALPVSHLGMLLSSEVAEQAVAFLRDGRFRHG